MLRQTTVDDGRVKDYATRAGVHSVEMTEDSNIFGAAGQRQLNRERIVVGIGKGAILRHIVKRHPFLHRRGLSVNYKLHFFVFLVFCYL